jgi:transcriptional regulator with PAS, ATPase and Fis domain
MKPFIPVNCPTIPENILESELFGYKRGAFTGASQDKKGLFGTANGGTLLLDEIGDLSTMLQAKLLRVLEEKELKPLGDTKSYKIDVRVIASTNQNLKEKIASLQFREDLYHRLNVVSISTPSLKEIPEDIPLIANHFLSQYSSELNTIQKRFSEDTLKVLVSRRWSGNVRELQNEIKRAVIFSRDEIVTPQDFQYDMKNLPCPEDSIDSFSKLNYKEARKSLLERFNIKYIKELLKENGGNVSLAARIAGLERQSLQHLMRRYGIHAEEFRKSANKI